MVLFLAWARDSSFLQSFHTGSGAHPAFYSMGTGDLLSEGKAA